MNESQILVTKPNDSTLNLKGSQKKYISHNKNFFY